MQPYSELANWDGSLSAPDSRSTTEPPPESVSPPLNNTLFRDMLDPLPTDPPTLPLSLHEQHDPHPHLYVSSLYDLYPKLPQSSQRQHHHQVHRTLATHPTPPSPPHIHVAPEEPSSSSSSLSCAFGQPSSSIIDTPLFLPNGHGHDGQHVDSVLSPQEREIMADITLDPDDDSTAWPWTVCMESNGYDRAQDASSAFKADNLKVAGASSSANVPQSKSPFVTVLSQRHLFAPPQPPAAIASTSTSVSPSPFAPVASKLSSSSPSHPAAKAKEAPDMDRRAHARGNEYVMTHATTAARGDETKLRTFLSREASQDAAAGGVQQTPAVDPPLDPCPSSQQSLVSAPSDTIRRSSSSKSSRDPQRRSSKTPLFLPSPTESASCNPPCDPPLTGPVSPAEPPDVISITSSSSVASSPPPPMPRPPRRSLRKKFKDKQGQGRGRQLMAYVLVPPLPPGASKSDYVPLEQLLHKREQRDAGKDIVRAGDNSGTVALAAVLQGAFDNNASDAGRTDMQNTRRRSRRGDKQKAAEPVVPVEVIEDEDKDKDEAKVQNQGSATLVHALSAAFAHNSSSPRVVASSVAGTSGSMRQLRGSTRVDVVSDRTSVKIDPPLLAKPSHVQLRPRVTTNADNDKNKSPSTPTSRRRNEKRQPLTPSSPQKKRRRLARREDDAEAHDAEDDGEIEIVESPPQELRRSPRGKSHLKADQPQRKISRTNQQHHTSIPSINPTSVPTSGRSPSPIPTPPPQSPPATPPPREELPLMILPVPSSADIVIPPRALNHLHTSLRPPDPRSEGEGEGADGSGAQTRYGSLQGFHGEEAAVGAHGLLVSPAAAATTVDSSVRAPIINIIPDDLHHNSPLDLGLDIVPIGIGDDEQERAQERQDTVRAAVVPPHALRLRISSTTHPDGPMLGFASSEHENEGAARSSLSADLETDVSSDCFGLGFGTNMDFMVPSFDPCFSDGTSGWINWGTTAGSSTDVVPAGEYVGDGTIDPSVLGGPGAGSPCKIFKSDAASASVRARTVMRALNADKSLDNIRDEEDVEGQLFLDSADGEVGPPPGKGKAKTRVVGGARGAGRRIGAGDVRIRTKSLRKALADENGGSGDKADANTEAGVPETAATTTTTTTNTPAMLSSCHHCRRTTARPKMCCTRVRESTGMPCHKLYCDLCVEKRYPDLTFDEFATSFSCPSCEDYCNCSLCSRARGEVYVPERNGGWRRWGVWPAPAAPITSNGQTPQRRKLRRDGDAASSRRSNSAPRVASRSSTAVVEGASLPVSRLETRNATTATAVLTLTGEPRDEATTVTQTTPTQPSTPSPSIPASAPATAMATADTSPHSSSAPQHKRCHHYVYIGKRPKAWGRLVSIPDPEEQRQQQQQPRKNGQRGKRKRAGRRVRVRLFAGSEEPLLLAQKRQRAKRSLFRQDKPSSSSSAASLPPGSSSPARGTYGVMMNSGQNVDEGVWPGEYEYPMPAPGVVRKEPEDAHQDSKAALRITPEEVVRAIGAAFAVGKQL